MIDNIAVGRNIARLRQSRNMTQQQLAAVLNVSHQAVSKWETGAALPDMETLMSLTQLFGVTMEQLLTDNIPADRFEQAVGEKTVSPIESAVRDIGNFFSGIFRPAEKQEEAAEASDESAEGAEGEYASEEPVSAAEDENVSADDIDPEMNTIGKDAPSGDEIPQEDAFDLSKLLQMAPFMSKAALDAILLEHRESLDAAQIARFAPFISRDCLEKLIQNPETEITWETLQRVAPFLKREMVDKLTKAAAMGGSFVRNVASQGCKSGEDLGKALGNISQKIGSNVEKVVRKAGESVSGAINDIVESMKTRETRVAELRKAAMERAMQDGKWEWVAAHIDEIDDDDLKRRIAQTANAQGMHDWVLTYMTGYADTRTIEAAIEAGNWGWLGDNVWQFEDALQEEIALAAAKAENWQWLSTYAEQISLENCADQIGVAAYKAQARILALQLAERCMNDAQRQTLANEAVAAQDDEFLVQMGDLLNEEYYGRLCLARAQAGEWDRIGGFIEKADQKSLEQMMELAIAEGNFDAIDMLDAHL